MFLKGTEWIVVSSGHKIHIHSKSAKTKTWNGIKTTCPPSVLSTYQVNFQYCSDMILVSSNSYLKSCVSLTKRSIATEIEHRILKNNSLFVADWCSQLGFSKIPWARWFKLSDFKPTSQRHISFICRKRWVKTLNLHCAMILYVYCSNFILYI